jgi:hypothetical protein
VVRFAQTVDDLLAGEREDVAGNQASPDSSPG